MAESVVSFLLGKIGLFLEEEKNLLTGVRGELENIKGELRHMKAFLRTAESMEETDHQVGEWIAQVREIAFVIEDVIDEFTFRHAHSRRDVDTCGFICKITQNIKNVKYRRKLGYEIQRIKPRIKNVSQGRERYKLKQGSSSSTTTTAITNLLDDHRGNALLQEEADLVGIKEPKRQLIQFLSEGSPALKVISVVGMGGLGKTTLVKKVYDDVKNDFKNHAWITVSQSFDINELLKVIIRKLFKQSQQPMPEGMEKMSSAILKIEIKKFLQESKYLFVLDDIWHWHDWESIKFVLQPNDCGSRVMLTTRNIEVADASRMDFIGEVYPLKPLPPEESMTLFCRRIFMENECPPEWLNITKDILERCEGLPLAIVAISGLLATSGMRSKDKWEMVKCSLQCEIGGDKLQIMTKILLLSYHDLPFYLKACMLYVCLFPEDYEIDCIRLIRLWIAEGFVEEKEGKILEEVAEGYLNELLNRSLIQVARVDRSTIRICACRVHDILREVILSKAKDQNFVAILSNNDQQGSRLWHEKAVRRLSVHNALGPNIACGGKSHLSKLRSFLVFGVEDFEFNRSLGDDLRLLTILDLRGTRLGRFPREILKLYHLRYLSLRDNSVHVVPSSIEKLQNLETLDLKNTGVTQLPKTIVNLQRLHHLLAYWSSGYHKREDSWPGIKAITGIGRLHSLQKLCFLQAEEEDGHEMLQEIGKLSQLRRLGIQIGCWRSGYGKTFCSTIDNLTNLRSLWVNAIAGSIIELQCISSPPRYLQRMYLVGGLEKVPNWISSLENLSKLELACSNLKKDVLEPIQSLPSLVHLVLDRAFDGKKLCFEDGGFQKLKIIEACRLQRLTTVDVAKGAIPILEELSILECDKLQKVPSGIEHLAKLKLLRLDNLSRALIHSINGESANDYWRVKHIPHVRIEERRDFSDFLPRNIYDI